jgi:Sec-independent protein translocase protein TatA
MGTILFLLLVFFVILPLFKFGGALWKARRQFKQFYNTMSGNDAGQQQQRQSRQQSDQNPYNSKKKKYDSTDGEYVAFEEIDIVESKTEHTEQRNTSTRTEQQIVDVEWEDL